MEQVSWDPFKPLGGYPNSTPSYPPGYSSPGFGAGGLTTMAPQPATAYSMFNPYSSSGQASQIAPSVAQSNLSAAGYNTQLADLINSVNQAAQQAANAGRLGPQGQQIQSNLLGNIERQSAGLLDPQTERMLQSGIAARGAASGMGVDSSNLAAAYRRALGQTIEGTEAAAGKQYIDLLAANPSAPIYNMGDLMVNPQTYASAAASEAARQQSAQQFADELAYKYAALNQANVGRSGGGGGGIVNRTPSAGEYNARPASSEGTPGTAAAVTNPFAGGDNYFQPYIPAPSQQDWYKSIGWNPSAQTESVNPIYDPSLGMPDWTTPLAETYPANYVSAPTNADDEYWNWYDQTYGAE